MEIVLIDHNDSFTYNIVELIRSFKKCRIAVLAYEDVTEDIVSKFDKIILSPGPGLPEDYPKTIRIIAAFYKTKPILGICLGHQMICSFMGAGLYNIKNVEHGVNKKVQILENSKIFKNVPKTTEVGLYHSWAVENKKLPNSLKVTAISEDEIIMGVEYLEYSVYGIQFHPESFLTLQGLLILKNFIE